jgi:hypothetical protein
MSFDDLKALPVPEETRTHKPIAHHQIVEALTESLGFRHIKVVRQEFAATADGNRMFGVLDLDYEFTGARFSIALRNSNNKAFRLGLVAGYRVFCCDNMSFSGDFQPVLAKHSAKLNLINLISVGVGQMQRAFEPIKRTVSDWHANQLTDDAAKLIMYEAYVRGGLDAPNLLKETDKLYFEPQYQEFEERTLYSLSNAFTSAFKELKPIQQFAVTGKLGPFLNRFYQPF